MDSVLQTQKGMSIIMMKRLVSVILSAAIISGLFNMAFNSVFAAVSVIQDDFEGYTDTSGYVKPDGWTYYGNSFEPSKEDTSSTVKSIVEADGNHYLEMTNGNGKLLRLGRDFASLNVGTEYALHFRAKVNETSECETIVLNIGGQSVQPIMFKGSGKFSPIGGKESRTPAGEITAYTPDKWYNFDIVGNSGMLTTYVDGIMCDSAVLTDINAGINGGLTRVSFSLTSTQKITLGVDDVELYTGWDALTITEGNALDGAKKIDCSVPLIYVMNNRIDPSTVSSVTLSSAETEVDAEATVADDLKTIVVTPLSALKPGTKYTVNLSGVKDLLGNTYSGSVQSFTTSQENKIFVYDFENYASTTGYEKPSELTYYGGSFVPSKENMTNTISSGVEDGNHYVELKKEGMDKLFRVGKDFKEANVGKNFAVHMRVRAGQTAECLGITLSFNVADETSSTMVDIPVVSFKGSGKFSLIGGSADGEPAGQFTTYDIGTWYNVDITGKDGILTTYIDGVLCDRRAAADVKPGAAGGLRRVAFDIGSAQTGTFDFDDMEVWGAYDEGVVTASSVQNGEVGVNIDSSLTVTFNNRMDPETLSNITLSSDNGGTEIKTTLSTDMKTVTITPESSLYTLTEYTLSLNEMKDLTGYDVYAEDITFTTAARAYEPGAGEKLIIDDSFENYTDGTGSGIPSDWTLHPNSAALDNGNFAVRSGLDSNGNRYLSMRAKDQAAGFVRLYQEISDNTNDYLLHYRVKANQTLETSCVILRIVDDNTVEFSPIQLKSSGKFSPIGGKADRPAAGVVPAYTPEQWYTIDVVSRTVGADAKITTYVDGKMVDSAMVSEICTQRLTGLRRLSVQLAKGGYTDSELGIDDIKLYTAFEDMKLVSGSVLDGAQNVSVSDSISYTFSNMIDSETIGGIAITDENGRPANITAQLADDLKTVVLTINEALYPLSSYTVDFSGVTDVLGGSLTGYNSITFTTEFGNLAKADVNNCALENGTFTADVTFRNITGSEQSFKGIAVIYKVDTQTKDAIFEAAETFDLKLGAQESETKKAELGDGTLTGDNYTFKVFLWDSLNGMTPIGNANVTNYIGAKIVLPEDFGVLPFQVYRTGTRTYAHTAAPEAVMDLSDAVEVFVSPKGRTNSSDGTTIRLGLEKNEPITPGTFGQNVDEGRYDTTSGTYILTCVDEVLDNLSINLEKHSKIHNLYIRSGSSKGISWVGNIADAVWSPYSDTGVYTADLSANAEGTIMYPVNLTDVDEYGMPSVYYLAGDLGACLASPGTYVRVENTLYVNPLPNEHMENLKYLWKNGRASYVDYGNVNVIIENMGFFGGCYSFKPNSTASDFYVFGSKFFRGTTDAFAISGAYSAYVIDSVAAYATADGFNYHASDNNSRAVEINCVSYCNGTKYRVDMDTDKGANSNNGSTAHNSIKMLRIGGVYQWCEGPIVADTNNCYSISIGCTAENVYDTTTGIKAAYMLSDAAAPSTDKEYVQKKYLVDCYAGGENLAHGCYITVSGGNASEEVFVLGLDGDTRSNTAYGQITWDDIMSGVWK